MLQSLSAPTLARAASLTPFPLMHSSPHPFRPELARLVEVGVLERAAVNDGAREGSGAFEELARAAAASGLITVSQALTVAALVGVRPPA